MKLLWHRLLTALAVTIIAGNLLVSGGAAMAMALGEGCDIHTAHDAEMHSGHTHTMHTDGDMSGKSDTASGHGMADCGMHACVFDLPVAAPLYPSQHLLLQVLVPADTGPLTSRPDDSTRHPPKT